MGVRANTGRDVDIAVLDSGVDFQHSDLAVDQARSAQCINGLPCVVGGDDVYGHGTRVAGVIGALDNESDLVGVAPQARVISVRVLNDSGQSSSGDILAGIDHVLYLNANSDPVEVANMSFREKCTDAAGAYVDCNSDVDLAPLHTAVRNLVAAGTTVVAGAGNDGIDTRYVAPAGFAEVIAVSALADSDGLSGGTGPSVCTAYFFNACIQSAPDDSFAAAFSNFGEAVDVIGPGSDELMLMNGGGTVRASGTSFSAPHAAAVAAIFIRDRWNRGEATPLPSTVRQALIETGECSGSALFRGDTECPTPWPQEMMDRVLTEVSVAVHGEDGHQAELELQRINSHHNFTQQEHHFGQDVWITRKGAIEARKSSWAMIPGSMGTRSYIVVGKENAMSFCSAPRGAGRRYSRTKARELFSMDDLSRAMEGIEYRHSKALLDEIPGAYKDIDDMMENAKELVEVKYILKQFVNVRGD